MDRDTDTLRYRKHIRLLKAASSDTESNTSSQDQEDKSRARLGTWFTGKSHIETMERRKGNLVFPTSVYLDNLASSVSHSSSVSRSQASSGASSPSVTGGERSAANMFEVSESLIHLWALGRLLSS